MRSPRFYLLLGLALLFSGCAVQKVRGYQNVYRLYDIPTPLLERVSSKLQEHGLTEAVVTLDSVGRLRLTGKYRNEDEVEKAFIIAQSIVGIKSTSPFYPEGVLVKRWEEEAAAAMADFARARSRKATPAVKRALVVGINYFLDTTGAINDIQGADDARTVRDSLKRAGYLVTSLLNEEATKTNIEAALAKLSADIGVNDTVFIYFSSHGTPPVPSSRGGDERNMSIVAYDTGVVPGRARVPKNDGIGYQLLIQETAVKDVLVQQVARRPSSVTRVFIDTCYSGEMIKNAPEDSRAYILKVNGGEVEREGISMAAWTGVQYTSKGIRTVVPVEGDKGATKPASAATKVPERTGYAVITATSPGERAWGPDVKLGTFAHPTRKDAHLRGSFFTQVFFEYLNIYQGDVQQAFDKASGFTQQKVAAATGGKEHQVPRAFSTIPASSDNLFN